MGMRGLQRSILKRWRLAAVIIAATIPLAVALPAKGTTPTPPVADLGAIPVSGTAPLTVTFDGSGSSDPNPGGNLISWDLSYGDGTPDKTGTGAPPSTTATHTYQSAGIYTATLSVTDNYSQRGTSTRTITVNPAQSRSPGAPVSSLSAVGSSTDSGIHKIKHVVMIMQENRSFDSYFGTYPGADGFPMSNGTPTVCLPDPQAHTCVYPYHDTSDVNYGGPHEATSFTADLNSGKMDGFISQAESQTSSACANQSGCAAPGGHGNTDVMGYHNAQEIPNYWAYAQHFTLLDHMFESQQGYSVPSHLGLVSLWSALCGSSSPKSCQSSETPATGPTAQYPWTDLTWLLHAYGVSWRYYVGTGANPDCKSDAATCEATSLSPAQPGIWNPLPNFTDVAKDGQLGNIVSTSQFYPAALNGTLPQVSWVVPSAIVSEHPPGPVSLGQAYVTGLINAIMQGPDWGSTAIFLTWDDWGGFYDNVVPPQIDSLGYGFRVPGIVISPYTVAGKVDHQTLSFDALAKFVEDDFLNGARLNPATDGRPDSRPNVRENASQLGNLTSDFNFSQTPIPPLILNSGPPWGPVPAISRTPTSTDGDAPLTVSFDASSSTGGNSAISSWAVSFGDGTPNVTGTGVPPSPTTSHTYPKPGTYTATLTVTNQNGLSDTSMVNITVKPSPPTASLTASPPGGHAPLSATFDGSGTTDASSQISKWDLTFGDGTPDATGTGAPPSPTASHTYQHAGNYLATLTVTDANGQTSRAPILVSVLPTININQSTAAPGASLRVWGSGFAPKESIALAIGTTRWSTATATATGQYSRAGLVVPTTLVPGSYTLTATGKSSGAIATSTLEVSPNWDQFRFGSSGGAFNPYETSISVGNVASLVPGGLLGVTGNAVASSPAVHNGKVFVGSSDGRFYEFDPATADLFHHWYIGNQVTSSPAVSPTNVAYVGSKTGNLHAYFAACGPGHYDGLCGAKGTLTLGGAIDSSPTVVKNTVYVGANNGDLYSINGNLTKFSINWSLPLGGALRSSPAVSGTTLVVGSDNGNVYGVDVKTQAVLFTLRTGGLVRSSPAIVGNVAYVGSEDGKLYAIPLSCTGTCSPLWTVATGGPIDSSPAVFNGTVYVGSNDGKLYAINAADGSIAWTMTTSGAISSSPAVANGVVYVGFTDGRLYAANAAGCGARSCSPLWSAQTGGPITSSPAVSNGEVFVGSNDGDLHSYVLPAG